MPSSASSISRQGAQSERPMAGSDEGKSSRAKKNKQQQRRQLDCVSVSIRRDQSGIQVASCRVSWHFDADPSNRSNRILSSGARLWPVMPNGRMEIPVSSRCGLDGSFHMDANASGYEENATCVSGYEKKRKIKTDASHLGFSSNMCRRSGCVDKAPLPVQRSLGAGDDAGHANVRFDGHA